MLLDLNEVDENFFKESRYDVCVCGSGPAGMSLAIKLSEKKLNVLLLEAGGLVYSESSQNVYKGKNIGLDYFPSDLSRLRYLGGTANHWGGWCRGLNESDFEVQSHIEYSGWPIKKKDLDPYLEETNAILNLDHEKREWLDYLLLGEKNSDLRNIFFQFSEPVPRFGDTYLDTIKSSKNITCVINANVVDINLNEGMGSVSSLKVLNTAKSKFMVNAEYYALCFGGIENPRALLNANYKMKVGVGNQNDLVGRFFMEHPHFEVGDVLVNHDHPEYQKFAKKKNLPYFAFYEPTDRFRIQKKVLNFGLRFEKPRFKPRKFSSLRSRLKRNLCESDNIYSIARYLTEEFVCRSFDAHIRVSGEQSPNPDSRIKLGNTLDTFGNRQIELDWRLNELDKRTLREAVLAAGKIMAVKDQGRVRLKDWILDDALHFPNTSEDEVGGYHHMGTTRMAESPKHGVVNKDLQVFGIDNLYLGGSSTFPTSGHANPTYTIIQLSLKLADHLASRVIAS